MPSSLPKPDLGAQRRLSDVDLKMAKVSPEQVRKADVEWRLALGRAVADAVSVVGWTLKEFAGAVDKDERQCARWLTGEDRPQFDVLFAVEALRVPLVVALARLAGPPIELETVIRCRRLP